MTWERVLEEAEMFRNAATALMQIHQGEPGISDDAIVKSGKLLRDLLPNLAQLEKLDFEARQHLRKCVEAALKIDIENSTEILWGKLRVILAVGGPLMRPHNAKKDPRIQAARFWNSLSKAVTIPDSDEEGQEAA